MPQLFLFSIDTSNGLLVTLVIGAIAGLLASYFTPGKGFGLIISIILGLVGGWLGNMLFGKFLHIGSPLVNQIICATLGAMILVVVVNLFSNKERKEDKSKWRA